MNANLVRKLNQYFVHLNAVKYSSDQTQPSRKLTPQLNIVSFLGLLWFISGFT